MTLQKLPQWKSRLLISKDVSPDVIENGVRLVPDAFAEGFE